MFKVEIENKKGEKKMQNCNEVGNVYIALKKLGINSMPTHLNIGKNENGVNLKLISDNDFDTAIAGILTANRDTLYDAMLLSRQLIELKDETIKEEIERNAVNAQYQTKEDIYADIRKMKIEFASAHEDFYCPLHVLAGANKGYEPDVEKDYLVRFEDDVREALKQSQAGMDMTDYVKEQSRIGDKLTYAEWSVEKIEDNLYGKISCYLNKPLTEKETERLKDTITGQNADGFGESFEQHPITVAYKMIYVSFWGDDYFLKTREELNEYLQEERRDIDNETIESKDDFRALTEQELAEEENTRGEDNSPVLTM